MALETGHPPVSLQHCPLALPVPPAGRPGSDLQVWCSIEGLPFLLASDSGWSEHQPAISS